MYTRPPCSPQRDSLRLSLCLLLLFCCPVVSCGQPTRCDWASMNMGFVSVASSNVVVHSVAGRVLPEEFSQRPSLSQRASWRT